MAGPFHDDKTNRQSGPEKSVMKYDEALRSLQADDKTIFEKYDMKYFKGKKVLSSKAGKQGTVNSADTDQQISSDQSLKKSKVS